MFTIKNSYGKPIGVGGCDVTTIMLSFKCRDCGEQFVASSLITHYLDPYTREPIRCPGCGSKNYVEVETIQVG